MLPVKPGPSFDCGQPGTSWESPPEEKVEEEELLEFCCHQELWLPRWGWQCQTGSLCCQKLNS